MKYYIECECSSMEHNARIDVFPGYEQDPEPRMFLSMHLKTGDFWYRLVKGIKYILGYRSRYGEYDEIIINKQTAIDMKIVCENYISLFK